MNDSDLINLLDCFSEVQPIHIDLSYNRDITDVGLRYFMRIGDLSKLHKLILRATSVSDLFLEDLH